MRPSPRDCCYCTATAASFWLVRGDSGKSHLFFYFFVLYLPDRPQVLPDLKEPLSLVSLLSFRLSTFEHRLGVVRSPIDSSR